MTENLAFKDGKWTEKWFDQNIEAWTEAIDGYKKYEGDIKSVLEIGCFEGRATVWLCNTVPTIEKYTVIDTFKGSLEEKGMERAKDNLTKNESHIRSNFEHNISKFRDKIDFTIVEGESQSMLHDIKGKYDFIYIDGSHRSDDVFVDAYWADKLLNVNGIMIFDDFGWTNPDSELLIDSPGFGIGEFLTIHTHDYNIFLRGYQLGIQKTK
jgi:SAM-dependent methyltransferase